MFFACASWVFLTIPNLKHRSKTTSHRTLFVFLYHIFVYAFPIILELYFRSSSWSESYSPRKDINFAKRIPWSILTCWLIVIPVYLFFLQNQSSHKNTWPKSKFIDAIFRNYDYSALFLSL